MKPFLNVESVYEDPDMIKVRVAASNENFSGIANCYVTRGMILEFGISLEGYPSEAGHHYSFGQESGNNSFFLFNLENKDIQGHILAKIVLAEIITYSGTGSRYPYKKRNIAELDFWVDPSSIDAFSISLKSLAASPIREVNARLEGEEI